MNNKKRNREEQLAQALKLNLMKRKEQQAERKKQKEALEKNASDSQNEDLKDQN